MSSIFEPPRAEIEHGERRIFELQSEIEGFLGADPYTRVVERSDDGTTDIHKLVLTKPMPASIPRIAADAAISLRAALDQCGYVLARASGVTANRPKSSFPFARSADELDRCRNAGSKHGPAKIFDIMVSYKPYKGGNDVLWAMNELGNAKKHRIVIPCANATAGMRVHRATFGKAHIKWPPKWDSEKNEMVLVESVVGGKADYEFELATYVAIAGIDELDGAPVFDTLLNMRSLVLEIVDSVEATANSMGLT